MTRRETEIGDTGRDFPSTHWSILLELHDPNHPRFLEHLNHLIRQYWKPVYHYARALRPLSIEDGKDMTQQFFAVLLQRKDLQKLCPERGSFRAFLKTALRHVLVSADRAALARQPRPGTHQFSFEEAELDWQDFARNNAGVTPDDAFDRAWAREVLLNAVERLRRHLASEGKELYFNLFREFCLEPAGLSIFGKSAGTAAPSQSDLATRYGVSSHDVKNHLRYVRQRIQAILREMLAEYLAPGADVEQELAFILSL